MTMDNPNIAPVRLHLGTCVMSGSRVVRDANGVSITYHTLDGWDSPPAASGSSTASIFRRGSIPGVTTASERNLVIEGHIKAPTQALLRDKIEELLACIPYDTDVPLILWELGTARHVLVRHGGQQIVDRKGTREGSGLVSKFNLQLIAHDPIKLSGTGTGPTRLLELPIPPISGAPVTADISYINAGRGDRAPLTFETNGTALVLTLTSNGGKPTNQVLTWTGGALGGRVLTIDFESGAVMLGTTPSRSKLAGRLFMLDAKQWTIKVAVTPPILAGYARFRTYDSFI